MVGFGRSRLHVRKEQDLLEGVHVVHGSEEERFCLHVHVNHLFWPRRTDMAKLVHQVVTHLLVAINCLRTHLAGMGDGRLQRVNGRKGEVRRIPVRVMARRDPHGEDVVVAMLVAVLRDLLCADHHLLRVEAIQQVRHGGHAVPSDVLHRVSVAALQASGLLVSVPRGILIPAANGSRNQGISLDLDGIEKLLTRNAVGERRGHFVLEHKATERGDA